MSNLQKALDFIVDFVGVIPNGEYLPEFDRHPADEAALTAVRHDPLIPLVSIPKQKRAPGRARFMSYSTFDLGLAKYNLLKLQHIAQGDVGNDQGVAYAGGVFVKFIGDHADVHVAGAGKKLEDAPAGVS